MAKVEIYTTPWCGYCGMAKKLLGKKGVEFIEYDVALEPDKLEEMLARARGARKVPQIFIDGFHVGGADSLMELEVDGELDKALGIEV